MGNQNGSGVNKQKSLKKNFSKYKNVCTGVTLVLGVGSVICGILVLLFFRDFVDGLIKKEIPIREGSRIAQVWQKPPITPYLKIYFFNVTNPRRFLKGAKPVLQEVGPFVYEEIWEKINITWMDNGDQVEFGQKKTYFFREDLSYGSQDTKLTLPNIPMLTSLAAVNAAKESESVIRVALGSMLEILNQTPFVKLTVEEIMWGYENPLIQLGKGIFPEDKSFPFDKFGLFIGKNGTAPGLLRTWTGTKDVRDVGQITAWNKKKKLKFWKTEECNTIKGTDGSTFHPDILRNETLYIFNNDLCRSLPLEYLYDIVSNGVSGFRFVPPKNVFAPAEENPYNDCYCMNDEGCDVPRGLFNLSACQFGSPVLLSWPHFFQADPALLEAVDGLNPEAEKHQFFIDIQPKLGAGLRAQARTQINLAMFEMADIKPAEGLRDIVFPVLWFADGIDSIEDPDTIHLLHTAINTPEKARSALYATFFVVGVVLILLVFLFLGYHNFYKPVRSEQITPPRSSGKHSEQHENNGGHYEMRPGNGVILASST